ncbi:MAG: TIGR01777 family oxidoreductase [Spirochaetes bacterium]|nr:TIGR01777 family oxidoreductase [Spirochaetota bacterium]
MRSETFIRRSSFPVSAGELFAWHRNPGALERLTPPWEKVTVVEREPLAEGSRTVFYLKTGPLSLRWAAINEDVIESRSFTDVQVTGPFSAWRHTHRFIPESEGSCILEDAIEYRLRLHRLAHPLVGRIIRRRLERMFEYRHRITGEDIMLRKPERPLAIVISGSSGLIGSCLLPYLMTRGHRITRLVRGTGRGESVAEWDPERGTLDHNFSGADAVIHLAGEPIGEGLWTKKKMRAIIRSRAAGTRLLAERLASLEQPPAVLVSASAIGYYGDRGDALLAEEDAPGTGFIADVCREWERAAQPAADRGIRVVLLRIGVVLHPSGGALRRFLLPGRLGLGGALGSGDQYISWISMEDMVRAIEHVLLRPDISGPVNVVAPAPARNRQFVRTLARVLRRPAPFRVPAWAVRLAFGRMGREVLLSGARVSSRKIENYGFRFLHRDLEAALKFLLGK